MYYSSVRYFYNGSNGPAGSRYVRPLKGLKQWVVEKCFTFIQGYERILEAKFPKAFRVYQVFSVGSKTLYYDVKEYMRISSSLSSGMSVRDLQRKELEVYFQVPKDLTKVAPVLLLSALPFANYAILPVIYLFPRQSLSSQFWSLQQKSEFAVEHLKKRLHHHRPIFRHLQRNLHNIENITLRESAQNVFHKLGSGLNPTTEEVLSVKPLFSGKPFDIFQMSTKHLHSLCRLHSVSWLPGKQWRLWRHAGFLREMDLAMEREGWQAMTQHEMRNACFVRGLSPVGLSKEEMITWLNQWIEVTKNCDHSSLSLVLHCPLFLSYNSPSNWVLIH
ncbi:hypothetical protein JTE90_007401 [Oedothorax gibbosus]|uniref:Letm1 RBD domain-containing protein n=1 Tax=Oedothorax gibbosus TaxID=931172 RepID=A0AAV6UHW5_9ARAC|nr:hypothetical protein JTE90_007401 [Oedothorax gibbosus]